MTNPLPARGCGVAALGFLLTILAASPLSAQLYLDSAASDWDAALTNWSVTDGGPYTSSWSDSNAAFFDPGAGGQTVTLGASFNPTATGLELLDGAAGDLTIEMDAGGNTITVGADGITNSQTAAAAGMIINPDVTLGASQIWSQAIPGSGSNTITMNGNLALGGNDLELQTAGTSINTGSNYTVAGNLSGSGNLTIGNTADGAGTVNLNGDLSGWTGNLTIDPGGTGSKNNLHVLIQDDLSAQNNVFQANQGRLTLDGNNLTIASTVELSGNGLFGGGALGSAGTGNVVTGQIELADSSKVTATSGSTLDIDGGVTLTASGNKQFWAQGNGATITFNSVISDDSSSGTLSFLTQGDVEVVMNALHTYDGTTTIRGGLVEVSVLADNGNASHLGAGSQLLFGSPLNAPSVGTLRITADGSTNRDLEFIASDGNGGPTNESGGTIEVTGSNTATFSGVLTSGGDAGGIPRLTKTGSGTLVLNGGAANGFDGQVYVEAGTLQVDTVLDQTHATLETFVEVQTGGTLSGPGEVTALRLRDGGTVAPGNSPGTLTASSLLWDGGGDFAFELGSNQAGSDLLSLSGALTKGAAGTYTFNFSDGTGTPVLGNIYTLVEFGSVDSAFSASDFGYTYSGALTGFAGSFTLDGDSLDFTVVPEPSSLALMLVGFGTLLLRRRRACS